MKTAQKPKSINTSLWHNQCEYLLGLCLVFEWGGYGRRVELHSSALPLSMGVRADSPPSCYFCLRSTLSHSSGSAGATPRQEENYLCDGQIGKYVDMEGGMKRNGTTTGTQKHRHAESLKDVRGEQRDRWMEKRQADEYGRRNKDRKERANINTEGQFPKCIKSSVKLKWSASGSVPQKK